MFENLSQSVTSLNCYLKIPARSMSRGKLILSLQFTLGETIAKLSLGQAYVLMAGNPGENKDKCKFNSHLPSSFSFGPYGDLIIIRDIRLYFL